MRLYFDTHLVSTALQHSDHGLVGCNAM